VDFDHEPVRTRGYGGPGHGAHFFTDARGMARIDDHGKVGQLLDYGYSRKIQSISGIGLEGPDASFTKNNLVIAFGQNIFGGHEPFFNGSGKPPF